MNKDIIGIIESVHYRLSKLDLTLDALIEIFAVLSLNTVPKFNLRVWDETTEPDEVYPNRVSLLFGMSRSDIRRLIKGQGLKVNNKVIPENTPLSSLPWLDLDGWKVCVIKKGKNEFDFLLK